MDFLSDFAPILLSVGVAALPVVGGVVSAGVLGALRRRNLNTEFYEAIERAGGIAYQTLLASGRPVTDRMALLNAARAGALYLNDRVPEQTIKRELSMDALTQIVQAQTGVLLAQDPVIGPTPATIPPTPTGGA